MKCKKCNKPIKENTDGDNGYCQGHSILEAEKEKEKGVKMFTKKQAVEKLIKLDHAFLFPEGVKELGEPFGVYKVIKVKDNRSEFKGLNLGPDHKEGDEVEGLDAMELAKLICKKEGVSYIHQHGRGSQLRVCCEALLKHLG